VKIKAALCAVLLGLGSSSAWAQMVVPLDLMPPYEAARIVRSAGLVPIARPTRWGASYVVPAIDRLGNTVRVMVDGRYGDILAVRRIAVAPPPGYRYPPASFRPPYEPYAAAPAAPPGYRPYPPADAARAEPSYRDWQAPARTGPNATMPNAGRAAAVAPPRPPVPRARPSPAAPVEARTKPPEQAPDASSTAPPTADAGAPAKAVPAFPPAQSLE
jgi:hypothetical protein